MRIAPLAVVLAAGLGLAGCYGSTEPATDLRPNSATLNAQGTSNNGRAYGYFEYWPTANPSAKRETVERFFPASVSGPISERVGFLTRATGYTFRACGGDIDSGGFRGPVSCAQTRTFTTPNGDSAEGGFGSFEPNEGYSFDASSGPAGENPTGEVRSFGLDQNFRGRVTCLRAQGSRAAVGAVGALTRSDGSSAGPATVLITIEAPNGSGQNTANTPTQTSGSTPPDCASASFANQRQFPVTNVRVQDAP